MHRSLSFVIAALGFATIASAQVTPIATDSFEYPVPGLLYQQAGGTGWSNAWWVSGGANDELVMFDQSVQPPFTGADSLGGYAGQTGVFGTAFRQLDLPAHPELIDPITNRFGADGETIWISFSTVNFQGQPQDHYGGLSLWRAGQNPAESLFLGSPWNSQGWGIDDEGDLGGSAPAVVVPGSNDQVAARIVVRMDYMTGQNRCRLWIDPLADYPTGTADLDEMVNGGDFDEIRLSSGGNNGDLYFWDNIVIAKGTPTGGIGTNYCSANPNSTGATSGISATGSDQVANNSLTLTASDLPVNSFGFFLTSQTQAQVANPGGSAGNLCLGGAIGRYVGPGQVLNSGASGAFSLALDLTNTPQPTGGIAVQAGETWSFTTWHRDAVGGNTTSNFTDGLEITFN
ncbi:MAG: hypothetical protein P8M11_15600 [Planctomycetota bacterium]|nr:hypothetical protein [Planctomycetota bacterium]MDG1985977.1 hypothetical protein [Planctomycetota bacterium]